MGHHGAELQQDLDVLDAEGHILFPAQDVALNQFVIRDCPFHGFGALLELLHLLEHAGLVIGADRHVVEVDLLVAAVIEFLWLLGFYFDQGFQLAQNWLCSLEIAVLQRLEEDFIIEFENVVSGLDVWVRRGKP